MNTYKNLLLLLSFSTASIYHSTLKSSFHDLFQSFNEQMKAMDEYFEKMLEEMNEMRESMMNSLQTATVRTDKDATQLSTSINDDKNSDQVIISITGIVTNEEQPEINARVEYDDNDNPVAVYITADSQTISLDYEKNYRFLSIDIKQEMKQEIKKDEKTAHHVFFGTSRQGKTLSSDIHLDQPQIDYDKSQQILTITFPKIIKQKKDKSIEVNIK